MKVIAVYKDDVAGTDGERAYNLSLSYWEPVGRVACIN